MGILDRARAAAKAVADKCWNDPAPSSLEALELSGMMGLPEGQQAFFGAICEEVDRLATENKELRGQLEKVTADGK